MAEGTVKWFNAARGFGIILPDERTPDVFVHLSSIEGSDRGELTEGQRVTFNAEPGPKGPRATSVRPLEGNDRQALPPPGPLAPLGGEDTD